MTMDQLVAELTATRRCQRLALIGALAPFYLAFALGWMFRAPIALFAGVIGMATLAGIYRRYAPHNPPRPSEPETPSAAGDEE